MRSSPAMRKSVVTPSTVFLTPSSCVVIEILDLLCIIYRGKLPSLCPGVGSISLLHHISNGIVCHGNPIPGEKLVLPCAVKSSVDCFYRSFRKSLICLCKGILFHSGHVAPKVVSIGECFIQKVVVFPDKLVSLIVFKGTGFPKYTIRSQLIFYTFNLFTFAKNSYNV